MKFVVSLRLLESQGPSGARNTSQLGDSAQLILLLLLAESLLFLFDVLLEPLPILLYLTRPCQFHPILIDNVCRCGCCTSSLILLAYCILIPIWKRRFLPQCNITAYSHCCSLALSVALRMGTAHSLSLLHDISQLLRLLLLLEHLYKVFIAKMLVLFVFNSIIVGFLFFLVGSQQVPRIENDLRSISSYLLNTDDGFFYLALYMN